MLGKLLKYEIPALGRKLVPLYIGWAVTAVLLGLAVGPASSKSDFMVVISALLYSAVAAAVLVLAVVMIIQRYSKSLLGDEAYFYQVLPATASEHIASKAVSALIWVLLSGVAMLLTGLLIAIFSGSMKSFFEVMPEIFRGIKGNEWLIILEFLILSAFSITKSVMAIYAAITIGHQAQKHTTIASIGAYIAVLWFEGVVGRAIAGLFPELIMNFDIYDFHKIFFGALAVTAALMAIYFFICKYLMEKRLNLN
jgi:hypothetical protein